MNKLINLAISLMVLFGLLMASAIPAAAASPTITVIAPNSVSNWSQGSNQNIRWNSSGLSGKVNIELYQYLTFDSSIVTNQTIGKRTYKWAIPWTQEPGTYRIKISSLKYPAYFDFSDNFTISPVAFNLTYPAGGEKLCTGLKHRITWTSSATTGTVKITLNKGTAVDRVLSSNRAIGAKGTGYYDWTIPDTQAAGTDYWINLQSNSVTTVQDNSTHFSIGNPLSVTSPVLGDIWGLGDQHYITWNHTAFITLTGSVKVELYKGTRVKKTIFAKTTITDDQELWTLPNNLPTGTDYRIKITSLSNRSLVAYSPYFTIRGKLITLTSPNENVTWKAGTTQIITWNETSLSGNVRIELYENLYYNRQIATGVPVRDTGVYTGHYDWTIPSDVPPGQQFTIKITNLTNEVYNDTSDVFFCIEGGSLTTTVLSDDNITYGDHVHDTVTVTGAGATPTGTVHFQVSTDETNWTTFDNASLSGGTATSIAYTPTIAVPHWFRVIYDGDSFYSSSASNDHAEKLDVMVRQLTVTAVTDTKQYDGNTSSTGEPTITSGSLVFTDTADWSQTFNTAAAGTGKHLVPDGTVTDGNSGNNYQVTFVDNITGVITALPLAVKADNLTKTYGDSDPLLTYSLTSGSLISPDTFSGALSRDAGEGVGVYPINQNTLTAGSNYNLTYVSGNLTINERPITATADNLTKTADEADPELTWQLTGSLVFGDTLTGSLTRSGDNSTGDHPITQGTLAANDNYTLTFVAGKLTITPGAIDHYVVSSDNYYPGFDNFTLTITARDSENNICIDNSTAVITMTSTGDAVFDGNGDNVFDDNQVTLVNGVATIDARNETVESFTVTATTGSITGTSGPINEEG